MRSSPHLLTHTRHSRQDHRRALVRMMRQYALHAVFQPLIDMRDGSVLGHEALIRGPIGSSLHRPDALLALGRHARMEQQLELFCIQSILAQWRITGHAGLLFINLSADSLIQTLARHGLPMLQHAVRQAGLEGGQLVIELTEHDRVSQQATLAEVVRRLRGEGVLFALDDFGDGHSSLRLWHELRPDFVKIDKYFTRGVHSDPRKLQIVQAIQGIAGLMGTKLVAEGIETPEELQALRAIGIQIGQGYLLGRPAAAPRTELDALCQEFFWQVPTRPPVLPVHPARPSVLQRLDLIDAPAVPPHTTHNDLAALFQAHPELHAVALVEHARPVGLVNRRQFMDQYAKLYFREVHGRRACIATANRSPRVVERDDNIDDLIAILISHDQRYLADGFIVTEQGRYIGLGTGEQLVRSVTEARIEAARHANPLTLLPGNIPLNLHIDWLLRCGADFVACHADLDNFKPFNDHYGYWRGDEMIRLAARLTQEHCNPRHDFVGHIGGDDFMILFQSADWEQRCQAISREFAAAALGLFDAPAREAGGIHAEDRAGQPQFFPCTTLSIGAARVRHGDYRQADAVATAAALAKHEAKRTHQRLYIQGSFSP